MLRELLAAPPAEFASCYAELLGVCPDATAAVAEAIVSRRPDVAREKKGVLSAVAPHVKANPAPAWLMACGFFCQALQPLQLGVPDADGCAIS